MGGVKMNKNYLAILIAGVGGQGILKAGTLLGEAALLENKKIISTEVHGMAQRGGSVVNEIKIGDVQSPLINKGEADIILSFEPAEALRVLDKASPETYLIVNTNPIIPLTVSLGLATYPDLNLAWLKVRDIYPRLWLVDARKIALEAGNSISENVVLLGVLCSVPIFPISTENMMKAIENGFPPKFRELNLKAFNLGLEKGKEGISNL